ncbi:urate hydroxylase PuuD [Vreelandella jeotgali]|uniref:urate hydroxylase PuuD n=1 Tax=Vreelandella jeotgali TaxID=553386 RepID=UPI00034A13BA|nr:urate hydroxylase PuuD [Halomonas jeotgali]
MQAYLLEIANLLMRWLHVIAAVAWIGESIYFVMLDNGLRKPKAEEDREKGVFGEMWAVHGGGFYHNQKYATAPAKLPEDLHWSFWKAYTTWLTGFGMFILFYMTKPSSMTGGQQSWEWAAAMNGWQTNAVAVLFLLGGWVVYNELCKRISPNMTRDGILSAAVAVMMIVVSYLSTHIFSGKAAFLLTGAVMGTAMSANVFFWIIPGQRRMVKAMKAGEAPNPLDGKRGKQRSVHNTYFTLPVLLLMVSNHFSVLYAHELSWILMALLIFAGAVIRQYFVLMHAGSKQPAYLAAGAVLILVAIGVGSISSDTQTGEGTPIAEMDVSGKDVMLQMGKHCVQCHAQDPSNQAYSAPPAGYAFDNWETVLEQKAKIKRQVDGGIMPLGNMTDMTQAERDVIAAW